MLSGNIFSHVFVREISKIYTSGNFLSSYQAVLGVRGLADAVDMRRGPAPDVPTTAAAGDRGRRHGGRAGHHSRRGGHGGLLQRRHPVATLVHLQAVHHLIWYLGRRIKLASSLTQHDTLLLSL